MENSVTKKNFAIGCFGWLILSNLGFLLALFGWSILFHGMDLYVWKAKITPLVSATIWLSTIIAMIVFLFKKRIGKLIGVLTAFMINGIIWSTPIIISASEEPLSLFGLAIQYFGLPLPISLLLFFMSY